MLESMASPRSAMKRQRAMMDRMDRVMNQQFQSLAVSSPKYEIVNNDELFQLAVAVPGMKMEDLDVKMEDNVLTVSGKSESKKEKKSSSDEPDVKNQRYSFTSSEFSQSFSLSDPTIDVEHLSAKLENGVLLVSAPKDMKKIEENIRTIPISAGSSGVGGDVSQEIDLKSSSHVVEQATTTEVVEGEGEAKGTITEDGLDITEEPTTWHWSTALSLDKNKNWEIHR